jgi:hypothetical protein
LSRMRGRGTVEPLEVRMGAYEATGCDLRVCWLWLLVDLAAGPLYLDISESEAGHVLI